MDHLCLLLIWNAHISLELRNWTVTLALKRKPNLNATAEAIDWDQGRERAFDSTCCGRCAPGETSWFALRDAPVMTGRARRSHLCWISSAPTPRGYQVNQSLHLEEKDLACYSRYTTKSCNKSRFFMFNWVDAPTTRVPLFPPFCCVSMRTC